MSPIAISGIGTDTQAQAPRSAWSPVLIFGAGVVAGYIFLATLWPPKRRRRA
jgi:hypothetical protein